MLNFSIELTREELSDLPRVRLTKIRVTSKELSPNPAKAIVVGIHSSGSLQDRLEHEGNKFVTFRFAAELTVTIEPYGTAIRRYALV